MAVLTATERAQLRRAVAQTVTSVPWTKAQINAAVQAIEDFFENNRAALGAAIEAAAPGVFNAPLKQRLVKYWLQQKYGREA